MPEPATLTRHDMDALNRVLRPIVFALRLIHRDWLDRVFLRHLSGAEFMILSAITTRTLPFNKVAEIIPLAQFTEGLLRSGGEPGDFVLDKHGVPVFEGTGLDKGTVRNALTGLAKKGLIERFSVPRQGARPVHAFMPLSVRSMIVAIAELDETGDRLNAKVPDAVIECAREPIHDLEARFCAQFANDAELRAAIEGAMQSAAAA